MGTGMFEVRHTQDEHCVNVDKTAGICPDCGVGWMGDPCVACAGVAFHKYGCPMSDANEGERIEAVNLMHDMALLEGAIRRAVYNLGAEDSEGRLSSVQANSLYALMDALGIADADDAYGPFRCPATHLNDYDECIALSCVNYDRQESR